jgi:hypothetical protein
VVSRKAAGTKTAVVPVRDKGRAPAGIAAKAVGKPVQRVIAQRGSGASLAVELPTGPRREVAQLAIRGILTRLAAVPASEATRLLASVRGLESPETRVIDWLRVDPRPAPSLEQALEAAHRRADDRKAAILKDPSMLSGEAAGQRLGVSRETINSRAQQGRLLALEFGKRGRRYPDWQFQDRIAGPPLEGVLAALAALDPWEQYRFFTQPQPALGGRTPVDALRAGEAEAALQAAVSWTGGEQGGG